MSGVVTEAARCDVPQTLLAAVIAGVAATPLIVTVAAPVELQVPSFAVTVRLTFPAPVGVKFTLVPVAVVGVALVSVQL